ncbi:branched-chain amino acid transport system II carrier protein [Brevibacillus choshinensis]|uniref:branched-chain amino acid transport system II carrier protein n=1 Tax=Brevibacillus choshinensis TaxID=54911 RepID=UPI002E226F4C|nr:branched-chain amino acid transport system II carrier protein [Brevibacillus choshinensis]MED4582390.1 branched-chain amino acid transport system II carrier protein [Brevibacillus choshinensis]MED4750459.1 branched-chain amino acid transport system II carrier protein [Brevibacillus choshinensis]
MIQLAKREVIWISFMLFSMFFGAGNLIFPPFLGQSAGISVWVSLTGFILSAVGLPILGVVAIAKAGTFHDLASRVHPLFALIFPFLIYVSIGPGLAIPRAGSLAFEMGMAPFLPKTWVTSPLSLFLYTILFFSIVFWLSLSPSKLVDRFGKWLTPTLLTLIALIFLKSLITPMGPLTDPVEKYATHPVLQGFLDGYLTMDALAALVFGIVIANTLRSKGVSDNKSLSTYMIKAGLGAGILLTVIYVILGMLGSKSAFLGEADNGAQILTSLMYHLFGESGTVILGIVFTVACLCVSIGLVTSCSQYFQGLFGSLSYRVWVTILCLLSMGIANLGLTQILSVSVPILGAIYPIAIVLIGLALLGRLLPATSSVYATTVSIVALFGVVDMINSTFVGQAWNSWLHFLPFQAEGAGWIMPALLAGCAGMLLDFGRKTASIYKKGSSS